MTKVCGDGGGRLSLLLAFEIWIKEGRAVAGSREEEDVAAGSPAQGWHHVKGELGDIAKAVLVELRVAALHGEAVDC